MLVTADAVTTV